MYKVLKLTKILKNINEVKEYIKEIKNSNTILVNTKMK